MKNDFIFVVLIFALAILFFGSIIIGVRKLSEKPFIENNVKYKYLGGSLYEIYYRGHYYLKSGSGMVHLVDCCNRAENP